MLHAQNLKARRKHTHQMEGTPNKQNQQRKTSEHLVAKTHVCRAETDALRQINVICHQ